MEPWDYHPDLTRERLIKVAALIAKGRYDALDRYSVAVGSNGWTVGCEAFQFGRHRITEAAGSEGYSWLSVADPSMQFVFQIGVLPVRFYRGPPDDPSERTLRHTFAELRQLPFIFDKEELGADLLYRFAVETDLEGEIVSISFVGLRGEQPVLVWPVPLDETGTVIAEIGIPPEEGIDLPKPTIRIPGSSSHDIKKTT